MAGGLVGMLRQTYQSFVADDAPMLAAAIAYSAVFAIAPLIVIAIAVAGTALGIANGGRGHSVIEDQLIAAIAQSAGSASAETVRAVVDGSFRSRQSSILAQVVGWITFVLAASGLFLALQNALNRVWHVTRPGGILTTLRSHAASALMLLVVGALVLITVILDVVVAYVWAHVQSLLPFGAPELASALKYLVDLVIVTLMFAVMFKLLPDTDIAWGDVRAGAAVSGMLFVLGEIVLSVYLGRAGIANAYGAVGSVVVLLVWIYYSAILLLFGAEFTHVYAERRGSRSPGAASSGAFDSARAES